MPDPKFRGLHGLHGFNTDLMDEVLFFWLRAEG